MEKESSCLDVLKQGSISSCLTILYTIHLLAFFPAKVYSRSLATEVAVATTNDVRKPDACVFVVTT